MRLSTVAKALLCIALVFSAVIIGPPAGAEAGAPGWRWLNPLPSGDSLNAVSMSPSAGSSCMWAVGNYGFIAKTFDYGASWHKFTPSGISGNPDLTDIDLVADSVGWAVGESGTIIKISDGWNVAVQTAPAGTGHLYAVDALNATTAYAVGHQGVVIKTVNGGTTWTSVWEPGAAGYEDFKTVQVLNADQAWVGGVGNAAGNNIYFFSNNLPYNKSTPDTDFAVEDLTVDTVTNTLWAVGRDRVTNAPKEYRVAHANVGLPNEEGLLYAEAAPKPNVHGGLTGISRPDATHAWVTSALGEVWLLDETAPVPQWVEQSHPYPNSGLNDVDFRVVSGEYYGVFVGSGGVMGVTEDGGTAWVSRPSSKLNNAILGIDFISTTTGYVTQGDNVAKTTDSGNKWNLLPAAPGGALLDIDFLATNKGWAVGRAGTALFFNGTAWTNNSIAAGPDLYSVSAVDATHQWACGDSGMIFSSTGGAWTPVAESNAGANVLRSIDFFGTQNGVAVGNGGTVVYTSDGGANWTAGVSGVTEDIWGVDMVSATVGFMVGDDNATGVMLMKKTTNGGATWSAMTAPDGMSWKDLRAVKFADANNGWIVGSNGTILHTTNAGGSWAKENMTAESFNAISSVSPAAAWAGGGDGALITNYTAPAPPPPPAKTTVYRFYNMKNGTHFYTSSYEEKKIILAKWPDVYKYEGVGYEYDGSKAASPLYRFYNAASGSHFFTASAEERDIVLKKWPHIFTYEGVAYNVSKTPVSGGTVYRFYNVKNGSHFFTANPAERDHVKATWPHIYLYEGPAFYLPM